MATERNGLRAWVRYDASNKAVAGSLIYQKNKPTSGVWKEYTESTSTPTNYGTWSLVTGGSAGDGTVLVENLQDNNFTFIGPNDGDGTGWVYLTKYYAAPTCLSINFEYSNFDEDIIHDYPVYWTSETKPTGAPSDTTIRVTTNPESGTWDINVPAGQWFSIGLYSDDSCCGRGFLNIDVNTVECPYWIFQGGVNLAFPTNQNGYTLYEGGWTQYDDGQSTGVIDFAGNFLADGVTETQYHLSTNGYLLAVHSNFQVSGNRQDLYLTPGDPLSDGDIQNFWYKNINTGTKWKTSILVYCGHCCGPESQATPYSYILNVYRDGNAQYVETRIKTSQENIGIAGINSFDIGEDASTLSQVWQSDLAGSTWTYLGYGSIV